MAANAGTLTFMVGGTEKAFAAANQYLQYMGKNIVHCGPVGNGQVPMSFSGEPGDGGMGGCVREPTISVSGACLDTTFWPTGPVMSGFGHSPDTLTVGSVRHIELIGLVGT